MKLNACILILAHMVYCTYGLGGVCWRGEVQGWVKLDKAPCCWPVSNVLAAGYLYPCSNSFVRFVCNSVFLPSSSVWLPCWPPRFGFLCQATLTLTVCVLLHTTFSVRRSRTYSLRVTLTRLFYPCVGAEPTVCVSPWHDFFIRA